MSGLPDATDVIDEIKNKQNRRRIFIGGGIVVGILVLCGVIVIGLLASSGGTPTPTTIAAAVDTPTPVATTEPPPPATIEPPTPTIPQPTTEPVSPPTTEPTQQPALEQTVEPTIAPTDEPTTLPTTEPGTEATVEPDREPTEEEPTNEPTSEPLSGKIAVPVLQENVNKIDEIYYNLYLASADNSWKPELRFDRASQPAFSKDGRGMVIRSWTHKDWAQSIIYLPDYTNLTNFRQMTKFVEGAHPSLNQNNELVFHRWRPGQQPLIFKMGTYPGAEDDEHNQMQLAEGQNPEWLGEQIIFYASFPKPGLYVMDAGGGNPTLVLESEQPLVPSAAPDGDLVAVSRNVNGRWQVFTFSAGQGESSLTQLTSTPAADNYLPTWSPDGLHIAFVSNRDKVWAVWVMAPDGSGQRKLFELPGPIDGRVSSPNIDPALSFGWVEERISWAP